MFSFEKKRFQVERELHRQEVMRERDRKVSEPRDNRHNERNSFKTLQRPPPLTKRQIAVVSKVVIISNS